MLSDDKTGSTDISSMDEMEEDDEEEGKSARLPDSNKSLLLKLSGKIREMASKGKKPKAVSAADDDDEVTSGGKPSPLAAIKQKKPLLVKVGIVGALAVLLLYDEIFPPETPVKEGEQAASSLNIPKRKKKQPSGEEGTPAGETPAAASAETPVAAPSETPAETPAAASPETPAETPAETVKTEAEAPMPAEAPPAEVPETPSVADVPPVSTEPVETPVVAAPDAPAETPGTDVATEPAASEVPIQAPAEEPDLSKMFGDTGGETSKDSVDGEAAIPNDENMTDKILQDLEQQVKTTETKSEKKDYVPPPDYEYIGRGLVYNCTGKHWACVDGASYKICEDNANSNKYLKKPVECYPFNVYQNQRGCESMQNRMVSSSAKTTFCSE